MVLLRKITAAALAATTLSACAGTPHDGATYDPYEPANRVSHSFNKGLDTVLLRPAAQVYDFAVPGLFKHLIENGLGHLELPRDFINSTLQGDLEASGTTLGRFVVNTVVGAGGLLDPATEFGLPKQDEDFGQTLAVWGVGEGPYVELPVFGPRTARGVAGMAVDSVTDPVSFFTSWTNVPLAFTVARRGVEVVDGRAANFEAIDDALYEEGDSYARLRSYYLQNRRRKVANGATTVEALPDIYTEESF